MTKQSYFSQKLKTQLIILFMVIISALMGLVGVIIYSRARAEMEDQSARLTAQYLSATERDIDRFCEEMDLTLLQLSLLPGAEEYLEQGWNEDPDTIVRIMELLSGMQEIMGSHDGIDSIFYFGESGTVLGVGSRKNVAPKAPQPEHFFYSSIVADKIWQEPWVHHWYGEFSSYDFGLDADPSEGTDYLTVAGCISRGGRATAGIVINLRKDLIADRILNADGANDHHDLLADEAGIVMLSEDAGENGTSLVYHEFLSGAGRSGDFVRDEMQTNFLRLTSQPGMKWILVSEVPLTVVYGGIRQIRNWIILAFAIAMVAGFLLATYAIYRLTRPLDELRNAMLQMEEGHLGGQLDIRSRNELGLLGEEFNRMSRALEENVRQIRSMEAEKRELEQDALQLQINPHFLFNTLTNIKFMLYVKPKETVVSAIEALSSFLEPIYSRKGREWTLSEELDYLKNYVEIMNYRFGDQIRLELDVPEDEMETLIPRFILQPILENSITHGFENSGHAGQITVRYVDMGPEGTAKEGSAVLIVEDDGCGMNEEMLSAVRERLNAQQPGQDTDKRRRHIGLWNVSRRLRVYYGEEDGLSIESAEGAGTKVTIRCPVIEAGSRKA